MGNMLTIAELRHKVQLCSQSDVVTTNGNLFLARADVLACWAKIEDKKGSLHGPTGLVTRESHDVRSHKITIRYRTDVDIKSTAWVYEARLKSPPRWFKVLAVADQADMFVLDVRLVERSENAMTPVAPETVAQAPDLTKPRAAPQAVKL